MKQNKRIKKVLSCMLIAVLIAAMALLSTACGKQAKTRKSDETSTYAEGNELGQGSTPFDFSVVDLEGNRTDFHIKTDEKTVGAALEKLNLIAGEQGEYGLYVKTVNGITADYEKDGCYWAFYINGEYASSGADTTEIEPGKTYMFKVEKG